MATTTITDDLILKAIVDTDGQVWFLEGDRLPERSDAKVQDFLTHPVLRRANRVRVTGSRANLDLILGLHERKVREELQSVEVCSPLMGLITSRRTPESSLFDMRRWAEAPSRGGWHEFTELDYPSYAIAKSLQGNDSLDLRIRLLASHPAWKALSFIPNLDPLQVCNVISTILDPRFFVDPVEPDRLSRLWAYMGITPNNLGEKIEAGTAAWRAWDVVHCWQVGITPSAGRSTEPNRFLYRHYAKQKTRLRSIVRTCQHFLAFLRHVWLDSLYRKPAWAEPLFVPEHFFTAEEAHAFREHVRGR